MSAEKETGRAVGPFTCMYCTRGTDNDCDICDECLSENIRMEPTTIISGLTATEYAYQKQVDDTERYWNARMIHGAAAVHSGTVDW